MGIFSELADDVLELLTDGDETLGLSGIFLTRTSYTQPVDEKDSPTDPVPVEYPLSAFAGGVDAKRVGQPATNGELIVASDVEVIAAAKNLDITPILTDTITVDGVEHRIIDIELIPRDSTKKVVWAFIGRTP